MIRSLDNWQARGGRVSGYGEIEILRHPPTLSGRDKSLHGVKWNPCDLVLQLVGMLSCETIRAAEHIGRLWVPSPLSVTFCLAGRVALGAVIPSTDETREPINELNCFAPVSFTVRHWAGKENPGGCLPGFSEFF